MTRIPARKTSLTQKTLHISRSMISWRRRRKGLRHYRRGILWQRISHQCLDLRTSSMPLPAMTKSSKMKWSCLLVRRSYTCKKEIDDSALPGHHIRVEKVWSGSTSVYGLVTSVGGLLRGRKHVAGSLPCVEKLSQVWSEGLIPFLVLLRLP